MEHGILLLRRLIRHALPLVLAWLAAGWVAATEVHRWRDDAGRPHYGDRPPTHVRTTRLPAVEAAARTAAPSRTLRTVQHVHDGDTVTLDGNERVRLLGINTPEVSGPYTREESGGASARTWLKQHIENRRVRVETDTETQDKYKRSLAHLFTEDGEHINHTLVERGLAVLSIYPPNLKYTDVLVAAERRAEAARLGVWGDASNRLRPIDDAQGGAREGWGRWRGTPNRVEHGAQFSRLWFPSGAEIRIDRDHLSYFLPLQEYLHRPVEVRGWASGRRGHPIFRLRHGSALPIIAE